MTYGYRLLGSLGEANPPANFIWPTVEDYCRKTADGLLGINTESISSMMTTVFPASTDPEQVVLTNTTDIFQGTMCSVIEAAVDKSLADISNTAAGQISSTLLSGFTSICADAFNGDGIDATAAIGTAILSAGQIVGVLSDIPLIGAIAGMVADWIVSIVQSSAITQASQDAADAACRQTAAQRCRSKYDADAPRATGSEGVTPADMFRGALFAYRSGQALPLNVASMYVLLCGDQTQGFGINTYDYEKILASVRGSRSPNVGIAKSTQRKMWKLIKGIMYSAEPYEIRSDIRGIGDKGRLLFPILQDIVRNEYLRYKDTRVGGWNDQLADALSGYLTSMVKVHVSNPVSGGAGVSQAYCDCYKPEILLTLRPAIIDSVLKWQTVLQENFFKNGQYVFGGQSKIGTNKSGVLRLSKTSVSRILKSAKLEIDTPSSLPRTLFIGTGMAVSGLLAWQGAKHLAHKAGRKHR